MTEIKHWYVEDKGKKYYSCNQAVTASENKITHIFDEVTCKNCRRTLGLS